MTVKLTSNFLSNARGITFLDTTGITWGFNSTTNALTAAISGSGLAPGSVTNTDLANMNASTIKGNNTGAAAAPVDLTAAQVKTLLSLNLVENTALSTWAGSSNIVTLGTVTTGVWNGTAIASGNIAATLTGKTYNGLTLTAASVGFSIQGGTTPETLTVNANATVSGTNTGDQTLPTGATPTGSLGLTAVAGSAATFMRSDAAPALNQAISPTWTGSHTFSPTGGATVFNGAATVNGSTASLSLLNLNTTATGSSVFLTFEQSGAATGFVGNSGGANQLVTGSALGDLVIRAQSKNILFNADGGSTIHLGIGATGAISFGALATATTAPAAGGAGALPATPKGYATFTINGTAQKIAYY